MDIPQIKIVKELSNVLAIVQFIHFPSSFGAAQRIDSLSQSPQYNQTAI